MVTDKALERRKYAIDSAIMAALKYFKVLDHLELSSHCTMRLGFEVCHVLEEAL